MRRKLLSRLRKSGGPGNWQVFFDTYWRFIYAAARRGGLTEAEALAAVEETVIAGSLQGTGLVAGCRKGAFKAWLMDLTKWRIIDQLRQRPGEAGPERRPREGAGDAAAPRNFPEPDSGMGNFWEEEWQRNLFAAAVERVRSRIKPRDFQMFDLYVLRRWPMAKVTAALGVNMREVYLAKHRATVILKREIHAIETRV